MKSVTRKEKIEYLIITVLLMILVAEGFAIRDIRVENREQQEVTVSERVYLKHNTKSYDVPFYMWIDGTGDADRIHKLESIVSVIKETDPEMYKTFVNTGWRAHIQLPYIRIPILTPGRSERTVMNMLREHIKRFTDEYMDFLRLSNLYNEIYKEIRTGVVTKKEDIFFINGKTITEYMDRISDYAADKSWFLQGKDFSLSAIKENLYHSWNRIVQKN